MNKTITIVLGVILLLVGLLGFVNNPVIGLFPVNMLHNLVHLLTGLLLVIFALPKDPNGAKSIAAIFGVIYLLVAIIGFVAPAFLANLLAVDMADTWLHLVLAVVLLILGFTGSKKMISQA